MSLIKCFAEVWSYLLKWKKIKRRKSLAVVLTQSLPPLTFHKITAEGTIYHKLKSSVLTAGNQNSSHNPSPTNSASLPQIPKSSCCYISPPSVQRLILALLFSHCAMLCSVISHDQFIGKDPHARKNWKQKKRVTEDEMVGWHHQLNAHESEQTPADSEGQGSLACCRSQGRKELDTT